jgi:hypothetical protein
MHKIIALTSLLLIVGLQTTPAYSQESTVSAFSAVFYFSTAEQASVVAAMSTFAQSECRKSMPAEIRVMSENWNGNETPTHSVIFSFIDAKSMTETFGKMQQCRAAGDLLAVLKEHTQPVSQLLTSTLHAGGDYTKDTAYVVFQLRVTDEATYAAAWKKLMDAQVKSGSVNGSYGLWRVQGGADSNVTHIAYVGAKDLETLLANLDRTPSKARAENLKTVAGIRTMYRRNIISVVADL